jgi:hypothetical protein
MPTEAAASPAVPIPRVTSVRRSTSKPRYMSTNGSSANASAKSTRVSDVRSVMRAAAYKPTATRKCGTAAYEPSWVSAETAWVSCEATRATCKSARISCEAAGATCKSARMAATESAAHVSAAAAVETTTAAAAHVSAAAPTPAAVSTTAMLSECR